MSTLPAQLSSNESLQSRLLEPPINANLLLQAPEEIVFVDAIGCEKAVTGHPTSWRFDGRGVVVVAIPFLGRGTIRRCR